MRALQPPAGRRSPGVLDRRRAVSRGVPEAPDHRRHDSLVARAEPEIAGAERTIPAPHPSRELARSRAAVIARSGRRERQAGGGRTKGAALTAPFYFARMAGSARR